MSAIATFTARGRAIRLQEAARSQEGDRSPSVEAFAALLNEDGVVRMLVSQMIEEVPEDHRTVATVEELLAQLNYITTLAPAWENDEKKRHFFPMSVLFTYIMAG